MSEPVELNAESLYGINAFRSLDSEARSALAGLCQGRRFAPEQLIVSHHDKTKDVFFILSGLARATIYSLSGREVSFKNLGPGEMFGELSAIDGQPRSAYVVALSESVVLSMSPESFWQALRDYPSVAEATLKDLTRMVRKLSERVFEFSALTVRDRIRAELLRLAQEHIDNNNDDEIHAIISPIPTHADFASRIGTHREAVTRELLELRKTGLVERRGGALVVNDVPRLAQMVEDVLGKELPCG